jgi:predicted acylesterase/phospholipase RssA
MKIILCFFLLVFTAVTANTDTQPKPKSQKVVLVLGSGGSRGLAHVGVIEE